MWDSMTRIWRNCNQWSVCFMYILVVHPTNHAHVCCMLFCVWYTINAWWIHVNYFLISFGFHDWKCGVCLLICDWPITNEEMKRWNGLMPSHNKTPQKANRAYISMNLEYLCLRNILTNVGIRGASKCFPTGHSRVPFITRINLSIYQWLDQWLIVPDMLD